MPSRPSSRSISARYASACTMCGERINKGDPIYPQGGRPAKYWICEPCQLKDSERPVDAAFVRRKIRHRLESPLVNRKSSPYTPRVAEARILGQAGDELFLVTDADIALRDDLKRWGSEGGPRALSWAKTRRLLQWFEQIDECPGVSPPEPEERFLDGHARDVTLRRFSALADGPPDGGHTAPDPSQRTDSR